VVQEVGTYKYFLYDLPDSGLELDITITALSGACAAACD
jgi:hypothetical protein